MTEGKSLSFSSSMSTFQKAVEKISVEQTLGCLYKGWDANVLSRNRDLYLFYPSSVLNASLKIY